VAASRLEAIENGAGAPCAELPELVHALANPLFVIVGVLELLLAEAEPGTKTHERLRLVQESTLEIRNLVRSLGERARAGDAEPAPS
jgi:hypothetical protein